MKKIKELLDEQGRLFHSALWGEYETPEERSRATADNDEVACQIKALLTPEAVQGELVARLQKEIADIDEAIADNPDARDEYGHMRVLLADSLAALATKEQP